MTIISDHVKIVQGLQQLGILPDDGDIPPIIIGEANDGINVGDGLGEIYGGKTGVSLKFRTLKAGANIIITTDEENETVGISASGTGGGDVEGTPPSRTNDLAIYYDASGLKIKDSNLRQRTSSNEMALQAEDPNDLGTWLDLIKTNYLAPNGTPGGTQVVVGNTDKSTVILGSGPNRYVNTSGKRIISELIVGPWTIPDSGTITHASGDAVPGLQLSNTGVNPADSRIFLGSRNPEGLITGYQGDIYIRSNGDANSSIYFKDTGSATNTGWVDILSGGVSASGVSIERILAPTPDYDDVQDTINQFGLAGTSGSDYVTNAGGGNVDIAAGSGFIRTTDTHTGILKAFNWAALTGQAIPSGQARYIGVDYNAGSPVVELHSTDDWDYKAQFRLASVVNEGGTLHIVNNPQRASDATGLIFERFYETDPLVRANRLGGIIPSETGTRNLLVSSGELYDGFNEIIIPVIDTSDASDFSAYYRDGVGGWTGVHAQTQWDNLQYDDGDGTLATFTNNRYGVHWLYIEADGCLVLLYGQGEWTAQAGAEGAPAPSTVPLRISVHGRLLGRIIFQEGQSTAISVDNVWDPLFQVSGNGGGAGDVVGPASSVDDEVPRYSSTSGKILKNSPAKVLDVSNQHILQFDDPNDPGTWLDAVQAKYTAPNGTPGGTQIVLGNLTRSTVLRSNGGLYSSTSGHKILHEAIVAAWAIPKPGSITNDDNDTFSVLDLITSGTNAGNSKIYMGGRSPEGVVSADQGSWYGRDDGDNSELYLKKTGTGNTGWKALLTDALQNVVEDTTPQLGGDLELNRHLIKYGIPGSDHTAVGEFLTATVDVNTNGYANAMHLDSDGNWIDAHADAAADMPCLALALEEGTGAGKKLLMKGLIRDDSWTWDEGDRIYPSDTATGGLTQTPPDSNGDQLQSVGIAFSATVAWFNPGDCTVIEIVVP